MMTLANIGFDFTKHKDSNSAKTLGKSLQIRNRAELSLEQCLKTHYRISDEKRNSIIELIHDYYSRIPFEMVIWNKYQVKQCIIDSILLLDTKFDPYKARDAFKLIEEMLINLVYLPWHQEFRKIRTYSGEFVRSISGPLVDVVEVFKAAGFKYQPGQFNTHLLLPESMLPLRDDSESVTGVIFDCLVAQVVLTNIIEVYENCLKAAKQTNDKVSHINPCSWIQSYFRERCYQTTELACNKIHDILNEVTIMLSRNENSASSTFGPTRTSNERVLGQPSQPSERSDIVTASTDNDFDSSPRISAQERTKKFLALQPKSDDLIESDLLRIPPEVETYRKPINQPTKYIDDETFSQSSSYSIKPRSNSGQIITYDQQSNNRHYQQQRISSPGVRSSPTTLTEHSDEVDRPRPLMDHQHNDKELLIPKSERRQVQSNVVPHYSHKTINHNINCDLNTGFNLQPEQTSRHGYRTDTTSHTQSYGNIRSSNMAQRNEYSVHTKYEPRHTKSTNNGDPWACSSCTYNNQPYSDVCEMCRFRRPSI